MDYRYNISNTKWLTGNYINVSIILYNDIDNALVYIYY